MLSRQWRSLRWHISDIRGCNRPLFDRSLVKNLNTRNRIGRSNSGHCGPGRVPRAEPELFGRAIVEGRDVTHTTYKRSAVTSAAKPAIALAF